MTILSTTERARGLRDTRPGVPWATVLTLSVAMSLAGAFWLVSLQGAIGAPERTKTAFATWLMLSLAVLPLFALAVVGALTLAMRWFGPVLRGRTVILTGLLIIAFGTLTGLTAIVASSVYDYSQQLGHIREGMQGMSPCTGSCVPVEQHEILVLHARGVLLVGRWLLLTNLVLVTWIVAMWGGRIKVATSSPTNLGDDDVARQVPTTGSLADDARLLLAGALAGAAVIHTAVIPEHLEEWPAAGRFFLVLTAAEIAVAGLLLLTRYGGRRLLLTTAAISVVPLTAWLWSRSLGLPFGPEPGVSEAVGVPDVLACVLELAALLAAVALLDRDLLDRGRPDRPALSAHTRALAALALIAVTTIGLAATGPAWFDAFGVGASQSEMEMSS